MRTRFVLSVCCVYVPSVVWALSFYSPALGDPVVCGDRVVFSGPALKSRRLICISKETGEKAWEIDHPRRPLSPWFPMEEDLIVTVGSDIYSCDVATGELTFLCTSGYERCRLICHGGSLAFVLGERDSVDHLGLTEPGKRRSVDFLSLVDVVRGKRIWERRNISGVVADGGDVVLAEGYERAVWGRTAGAGMRQEGRRLIGFWVGSGRRLWLRNDLGTSFLVDGIYVDGGFAIAVDNTVRCLAEDDGRDLNTVQVDEDSTVRVALASWGDSVVAWTSKGWRPLAGHMVVSFSAPELEEGLRFEVEHGADRCCAYGDVVIGDCGRNVSAYNLTTKEKLWEGAGWGWDGVHDGYIYFTTTAVGLTHTSVNRIEVRTGRQERLYEEELPEELR